MSPVPPGTRISPGSPRRRGASWVQCKTGLSHSRSFCTTGTRSSVAPSTRSSDGRPQGDPRGGAGPEGQPGVVTPIFNLWLLVYVTPVASGQRVLGTSHEERTTTD